MRRHLDVRLGLLMISLVLILSIFALMMLNGSVAWFANNDRVDGNGISITVKATPNVIIGKTEANIAEGIVCFEVDFKDAKRNNMVPVTRDPNEGNTFLKYITNHYAVDHETGNALPGQALAFSPVPETDNEEYFVDHFVYIATVADSIAVNSLMATISVPDSFLPTMDSYMKAASIDFYVGEVSAEGYCGTASIAGCLDNAEDGSIDLLKGIGGSVPLHTTPPIKVIMRCYFDGALVDEKGKAYINTYDVKATDVVFGVQITAHEKP